MLNGLDYQARVTAGKAVEKEILDVLRKAGLVIEEPTAEEDMQDKIDGWIVRNGVRVAIQVKYREGGDDVIFELVKDIDRGIIGRDMESKAQIYIVMDTTDTIRMFDVAEIKKMAELIKPGVLGELARDPSKKNWGNRDAACNVKITVDGRHGQRKLMAFFNPNKLKALGVWQK